MRPLFQLLVRLVIAARRIGYVKPASIVEGRRNGSIHQRLSSDQFDFKPVGDSQRLRGEFELSGGRGRGSDDEHQKR
jgi:hypothetical protein